MTSWVRLSSTRETRRIFFLFLFLPNFYSFLLVSSLFLFILFCCADSLSFSFSLNIPSALASYFTLALRATLLNSLRESLWSYQMSRNGIDASFFFYGDSRFYREKNITRCCVEQPWWGNRDGKCTFRRSTCHAMPKWEIAPKRETRSGSSILRSILRSEQ